MNYITIGSIDIGLKNFAQCVEKVDLNKINAIEKKYSSLPKHLQKRVIGNTAPEIEEILQETFLSGELVDCGVYNLNSVETEENSKLFEIQNRMLVFKHLDTFRGLWQKCDIVLIEQQYFSSMPSKFGKGKTGGTEANIRAIKIAECVLSWFLIRFPFKEITFFGSQYKTQLLGAPNSLTKPQRKKWSVEKATKILQDRNDTHTLEKMKISKKSKQKQDDVCDTIIQLQAYKFRCLIGNF